MVAMADNSSSVLQLDSEGISIIGRQTTHAGWYEFEVKSGGGSLGIVGGQVMAIFCENMLSILRKKDGFKLNLVPEAPFKEMVGGNKSEYLGNLSLSGYNTFYFFREKARLTHVVLADSAGNLMAHSCISPVVLEDWLRKLEDAPRDGSAKGNKGCAPAQTGK